MSRSTAGLGIVVTLAVLVGTASRAHAQPTAPLEVLAVQTHAQVHHLGHQLKSHFFEVPERHLFRISADQMCRFADNLQHEAALGKLTRMERALRLLSAKERQLSIVLRAIERRLQYRRYSHQHCTIANIHQTQQCLWQLSNTLAALDQAIDWAKDCRHHVPPAVYYPPVHHQPVVPPQLVPPQPPPPQPVPPQLAPPQIVPPQLPTPELLPPPIVPPQIDHPRGERPPVYIPDTSQSSTWHGQPLASPRQGHPRDSIRVGIDLLLAVTKR